MGIKDTTLVVCFCMLCEVFFCLIVSGFLISLACKAQTNWDPEQHAVIVSERGDGRFTSSYAIVHQLVKNTRPSLSFHSEMRPEEMPVWQSEVRQTMMKLMAFPDYLPEKKPICVSQEKRDGYTLENGSFIRCLRPFLLF